MKNKFTINSLNAMVLEEMEKYSKKKTLISEKAKLEAELKSLNEVAAGAEMESDKDYHQGQREPEFEKKGSHIVEDNMNEGVEMMVKFKGNDVYLAGDKVGEMQNAEFVPIGGGDVMKAFGHPDVKSKIAQRFSDGESSDFGGEEMVSEMDNDYDEEPAGSDRPAWMNEVEVDEEVNIDAQIKEDLAEMMEPEMAEEITETISEMDEDEEEEVMAEGDEDEEEVSTDLYESQTKKRRDNIMAENTLNRMRVLSGISPRWDDE